MFLYYQHVLLAIFLSSQILLIFPLLLTHSLYNIPTTFKMISFNFLLLLTIFLFNILCGVNSLHIMFPLLLQLFQLHFSTTHNACFVSPTLKKLLFYKVLYVPTTLKILLLLFKVILHNILYTFSVIHISPLRGH